MTDVKEDLWQTLQKTSKKIFLYGMGNGADKILRVCEEKGIPTEGFFASDGFVRGQVFHQKKVLSWSEVKERYGAENVTVLLSFGTSRPEVLENIYRISSETELYAPDVPAFGDGLFDLAFYRAHESELAQARALLCDEESCRIWDNVIRFKLTGDIRFLSAAESSEEEAMQRLLCPKTLKVTADLGAYTGDTVRKLLDAGSNVRLVYAMEPDMKNYRKLVDYAERESRATVVPVCAGAWSEDTVLYFDGSGNRNASPLQNRSQSLSSRPIKRCEVFARTPDGVFGEEQVDYIKYDVEGSEAEAILGSVRTIQRCYPTLLVSVYHRNEDLFSLPLTIHRLFPAYKGFYLRRFRGIPAWDMNLYVKKEPYGGI